MSLNKVMLIGSVGQIEVKVFEGQNGSRKCATFSLATNERYKDRSGNVVTNTEWHNIVSWNHGDLCEKWVKKGTPLFVEGKLRTRTWNDQQGNKRYTTEILAEKIELLGKKESSQDAQPQQADQQSVVNQSRSEASPYSQSRSYSQPMPPAGDPQDDDLPF